MAGLPTKAHACPTTDLSNNIMPWVPIATGSQSPKQRKWAWALSSDREGTNSANGANRDTLVCMAGPMSVTTKHEWQEPFTVERTRSGICWIETKAFNGYCSYGRYITLISSALSEFFQDDRIGKGSARFIARSTAESNSSEPLDFVTCKSATLPEGNSETFTTIRGLPDNGRFGGKTIFPFTLRLMAGMSSDEFVYSDGLLIARAEEAVPSPRCCGLWGAPAQPEMRKTNINRGTIFILDTLRGSGWS